MPKIRYLKPEFFLDPDLANLKPLTRIAFQGLWCYADREGRLEDDPRRLKVEVLPYDNVDMEKTLSELHPRFIVRYQENGKRYIQIINFSKHQHPHPHEPPSQIAICHDKTFLDITCHGRNGIKDPDLLIRRKDPDLLIQQRKDLSSNLPKAGLDKFEEFWGLYPRHEGKQAALKAWSSLSKSGIDASKILSGLKNQLEALEAKDIKYRPLPSTWLNGKRWEDEIVHEKSNIIV